MLDLLTFYGVGPVEREQLLTLAEQANRPGWWHRFNDILPDWFQSYVGMEEAATSIRVYEPQFVPGLLQIPTYTAAVLAVCDIPLGEAERHVILRKERQRRFTEGRLKLWAIIEETALRRPVGSKEILRDQLRYLLSLSHRPNFTLQIIPVGDGRPRCAQRVHHPAVRRAGPAGRGLPGTPHQRLYFDKKSEVDRYLLAMERLSIVAAKPDRDAGHPDRDHRRAGGGAVSGSSGTERFMSRAPGMSFPWLADMREGGGPSRGPPPSASPPSFIVRGTSAGTDPESDGPGRSRVARPAVRCGAQVELAEEGRTRRSWRR